MFPDTGAQVGSEHAGIESQYSIEVTGLPAFTSSAGSFTLGFNEFDSGPNFGPDNVNYLTPAVNVRVQLVGSSDQTHPCLLYTSPSPRDS